MSVLLKYRLIKTTRRLTFDILYQSETDIYDGPDDGDYSKFVASNGYEVISRSRMDIQTERIWLLGAKHKEESRSGTMVFSDDEKRDKAYDNFVQALNEWAACLGGVAKNLEDDEVELNPIDISVSVYPEAPTTGMRVGMPTGVKLTHIPTGISVTCNEKRSQHLNRETALKELRKKVSLYVPTPKVNVYLPDDDSRKAKVRFVEPRDGELHVYVSVDKEDSAQPEMDIRLLGWIKQSELDNSKVFGGSINLWLKQYDCDIPIYVNTKDLAQKPEYVVTSKQVAALRELTDEPLMVCKRALIESEGDFERAKELIRIRWSRYLLR